MNVTTITPSTAAYKRAVGANAVIAIPLIAINLLNNRNNPVLMLVLILGTAALCLLGMWLYFRNTRIQFGEGRISRRNLFGGEKSWAFSEIGHVLRVERLVAPMQPITSTLLLLDTEGRKIIRTTSTTWDDDHVYALLSSIPLQPEVIAEPTTAKALRVRYPRAFAWWEAHPWAFGWIIALGILAVVVIAVLAFM